MHDCKPVRFLPSNWLIHVSRIRSSLRHALRNRGLHGAVVALVKLLLGDGFARAPERGVASSGDHSQSLERNAPVGHDAHRGCG